MISSSVEIVLEPDCNMIKYKMTSIPVWVESSLSGLISVIALFIKELSLLVLYVKNNAFPQSLSEKDENKYLKLMAEGDGYARNMLIEYNLRLVAHIVKTLDPGLNIFIFYLVNYGNKEYAFSI